MKNYFNLFALASLAMVSCQQDLDTAVEQGQLKEVQIAMNAPEVMAITRSASGNSAMGGLTNVDWNSYDLRYQLAIYDESGVKVGDTQVATVADNTNGTSVRFTAQLTTNTQYKFVAWADFVTQGAQTDLHYDTTDLTNITLANGQNKLNDESRDAYFVTQDATVTEAGLSLTLKRPFAKLRIVANDWDLLTAENTPDEVTLTYKNCKRFTALNAVTGAVTGSELDAVGVTLTGDMANYDETGNEHTLIVDYVLAEATQHAAHFFFQALKGTTAVAGCNVTTDIPLSRNNLTTATGNFINSQSDIDIVIDCDGNIMAANRLVDNLTATAAAGAVTLNWNAREGITTEDFDKIVITSILSFPVQADSVEPTEVATITDNINITSYTVQNLKQNAGIYKFTVTPYKGETALDAQVMTVEASCLPAEDEDLKLRASVATGSHTAEVAPPFEKMIDWVIDYNDGTSNFWQANWKSLSTMPEDQKGFHPVQSIWFEFTAPVEMDYLIYHGTNSSGNLIKTISSVQVQKSGSEDWTDVTDEITFGWATDEKSKQIDFTSHQEDVVAVKLNLKENNNKNSSSSPYRCSEMEFYCKWPIASSGD